MNCTKCGQPLEPGATFCGNCGQPVQQIQNVTQVDPGTQQAPIPDYSPQPNTFQQPTPNPGVVVSGEQPQQNVSPMAQVLANQPYPTAPNPNNFNNPAFMSPGINSGTVPAYAMAGVGPKPHNSAETKSIIGLILGIIGIPGSLIPLIGLALGIAGLVLSTSSRAKYKHLVNTLAIVFSSIAIVVALGIWVWNIERSTTLSSNNNSASGVSGSNANLKAISTPCYNVKIDSGLDSYTPTNCNFDSASTAEEFTVTSESDPSITTANLQQIGSEALQKGVSSTGGTITSGSSGEFAGSPAYIVYTNLPSSQYGIFAFVLHTTSSGNNIFIVSRILVGDKNVTFGPLESTWQWK